MAHPFEDANGRFARAVVHFALARQIGRCSACIALMPFFYRNAKAAQESLNALSEHGDWSAIISVLLRNLELSIAASEQLIE